MIDFRAELRRLRSSSLARNAGWMVVGQGSGFLLQAAYFVLIARLLGAYEYGVYAAAFAVTGILGQYSTMGSGTLFLRYVTADPANAPVYWGNILAMTTVVSVVMVAALSLLSSHLLIGGSRAVLVLAAVANCFCNPLTSCAARVFQTYEEMRTTAALTLGTNLARALAAAAMLFFASGGVNHASAYKWSLAMAVVSILAAIAAVVMVTAKVGWPRFSLRQMRADLQEGFGFSFATSTSSAYNDIDKTMLGHYGMNLANGIYTMAYRVIDVATIPVLAVREAAMPSFFRSGGIGIRASALLACSLLKKTLPMAILSAILVFAAAPLVPHLLGKGFNESISALRWLCLIPVFRSIHHMAGSALTGSGKQGHRTAAQLIAAAFNFAANLCLIPRYGWLGAAWSSLMTDGLLAIANSGMLAWMFESEKLRVEADRLVIGA